MDLVEQGQVQVLAVSGAVDRQGVQTRLGKARQQSILYKLEGEAADYFKHMHSVRSN